MLRYFMLLVTLVFVACTDRPAIDDDSARAPAGNGQAQAQGNGAEIEHSHDMAPAEITSGSIYNLAGTWWDAAGDTAPLARLGGRPQVVALVYTSCAQACPAIVGEMKRIEAALGADAARVGFVLASMDPERDTPAKLAEFARRAGLDAQRWTLLAAPDADVLELAAVLGVQYRRLPDGEFTHSNILTVVDANGEIAHRQLGIGEGTAATVESARGLIHTHADS